MKVVLAEKPSVAKDLAAVLGATGKGAGYFEGNGYQVTWAIGHLVELADTKDYGYGSWQLSNLPIIPQTFQTKVTGDPGRARQFAIIAELFRKADTIICATDAGREGELIFRYIYEKVGGGKPVQRLWVSSQTDKALKEGFARLRDGREYDNLYAAARCRSEADWLVGINATQAYTLKYGYQPPFATSGAVAKTPKNQPLSLGRVQTPVLKLLVDRHQEAVNFKPETYWELILTLEKSGQKFQAKWFRDKADRFTEEKEGLDILARLEGKAQVRDVAMKPKTEMPPLLYDLTTLQKDANKRYNFSAQHTLDLTQDLYEKYKTLTYPRTDSRYLSDDIFPLVPDLLDNVARIGAYAPFVAKARALGIRQDRNFFNNAKVSDHHAIIPTETDPTRVDMPREHFMIYDMVVRRFVGIFLGNCQKELSDVVLLNAGETFRAKGTMISTAGWREIYFALDEALAKRKAKEKAKPEPEEKDREEENALPLMAAREVLPVLKKELPKKKTKAPSIHTESSILAMMETAGKEMEDDSLREAMKDRGLGTPATRAGMIERLLERGYIVRDKKKLIPTERGIALIGLVHDKPIASPELTGEWEMRLNKMAKGEYPSGKFMDEVKRYTHEVVSFLGRKPSPKPTGTAVHLQGSPAMPDYELAEFTCPKCKEGKILKGKQAFGCSRYREGCNFTLKPLIAGKLIERNHLEDLLTHGITSRWVKGFTNKNGKRFDARLRLDAEAKVAYCFEDGSVPSKADPADSTD
ncbi:MAG: topoisomerase [Bacteroidota bacterium]